MEINFADWLRKKLKERDWTQAELSRRSGVSTPQITRVLSGERGLGEQSIKGIAQALQLPPEVVFRAAGLLPQVTEKHSKMNELDHLATQLEGDNLQDLIDYAKMRLKKQEDEQEIKQTSRGKKTLARIVN
jgi:transcriptional regulator with XRE-family HTH domain